MGRFGRVFKVEVPLGSIHTKITRMCIRTCLELELFFDTLDGEECEEKSSSLQLLYMKLYINLRDSVPNSIGPNGKRRVCQILHSRSIQLKSRFPPL